MARDFCVDLVVVAAGALGAGGLGVVAAGVLVDKVVGALVCGIIDALEGAVVDEVVVGAHAGEVVSGFASALSLFLSSSVSLSPSPESH